MHVDPLRKSERFFAGMPEAGVEGTTPEANKNARGLPYRRFGCGVTGRAHSHQSRNAQHNALAALASAWEQEACRSNRTAHHGQCSEHIMGAPTTGKCSKQPMEASTAQYSLRTPLSRLHLRILDLSSEPFYERDNLIPVPAKTRMLEPKKLKRQCAGIEYACSASNK